MFAKLLTAFTLASVGGVVGVGVVNECSTKPAPVKSAPSAPVALTAPPVIQFPPVLGQGPTQGTGSTATRYAAMYPGWTFWTLPMTQYKPIPNWFPAKLGWTLQPVVLYCSGPAGMHGPAVNSPVYRPTESLPHILGWQPAGGDGAGTEYWQFIPCMYDDVPPAP